MYIGVKGCKGFGQYVDGLEIEDINVRIKAYATIIFLLDLQQVY